MKDVFEERRIGLETQFFVSYNRQLLEKMQEEDRVKDIKNSMMAATGIHDESTLDELIKLELTTESLLALSLVPLIQVAWADGEVMPEEKEAILKAADAKGITKEHAAYHFLENWLHDEPKEDLFHAWQSFIYSLAKSLGPVTFEKLHCEVLAFTKEVAESAGGFLGFGKISAKEEKVLEDIRQTFHDCQSDQGNASTKLH